MIFINFYEASVGMEIGFSMGSVGKVPQIGDVVYDSDSNEYKVVSVEKREEVGNVEHWVAWVEPA